MKRICHITTSHNYEDTRIFNRECRGLVEAGYNVTLIAVALKEETINGVHVIPLPITSKYGRKFKLPKIAYNLAMEIDADLYHFHDPELLPYMAKLAKKTRKPVVWDVHELYTATIKEFTLKSFPVFRSLVSWVFNIMERWWCRKIAGIITVTDILNKRYEKFPVESTVIKNVIDLKHISPSQKFQDKSGITVIASGTTNESRCIYQLIDAFAIVLKKHKNSILKLIAQFDSPLKKTLIEKYIVDSGIQESVKIKPLFPWADFMSEEVPNADIGMVLYAPTPNNMLGLPNRLFEYWACKLPVVATATPVLTPIIKEASAGILVVSSSPEEIADAILKYMDDPDKRKKDGENGCKAVKESWNWGIEVKKLCGFYENLLERWEAKS